MERSLSAVQVPAALAASPVRVGRRDSWPAWLLGLCVGVAYFLSSPRGGDFWWFDASRHAMNSVFVHDFFAQGGWRDPLGFAKAYYDQYPGINIGFYPPFLYAVTAPVLGLLGVGHGVCQGVVAAFAALVAMGGYAWTRPVLGRPAAVAAGLMLVLGPEMALWGRQVQLDVPAVALLLWGAWALAKWMEAPRRRWLMLAALLLGCAMLTRVQTVFAWPWWLAIVFLRPAGRAQPWRPRLMATALYGVLSLPSVASAIYFARVVGHLAGQMPDMPPLWSWANWGWYAARFPEQLGVVGMAVLLLGVLLSAVVLVAGGALPGRRQGEPGRPAALRSLVQGRCALALSMALLAWGFFSAVSNKEPRFDLPVLPFALLASFLAIGRWGQLGRAADAALPAPRARWAAGLVMLLGAAMLAEAGLAQRWASVPRVTGHREAALLAARLAPAGSRVMISAHRDGNFIFALRADGQRPDLAVRRADKLLVDMTIMRQLGIRDRGLTEQDIEALLARERVSVVVAQTGYLGDQPSMQALDRLLSSGCCFALRGTVPIGGAHRPDETELRVYVRR